MKMIDTDEIRIKPEYMHDICGVVMIRVEDIARILNDMPTIEPEQMRCENCKHCETTDNYIYCHEWLRETSIDGYCYKGDAND